MDVLELFKKGELAVYEMNKGGFPKEYNEQAEIELIRLAKLGQRMQWTDGVPPAFAPNDRRWIVIEYLTPYLRTKAYISIYWNGASYSDNRVQLARRWMSLPLPPNPGEGE
jgi:hypothetical protein